jgi:DNA-directed RNA polymerase specialized sigma24 family protein
MASRPGIAASPRPARRSTTSGLAPFDRIVEQQGPAVPRFCHAQVGPQQAEDTFQETMLAARRAYGALRDEHVCALPGKQGHAVMLRYRADLPYPEGAQVMQTSEAAARRSVFEGLKRLRKDTSP